MENGVSVSKKALQYRFVTKEIVGIVLTILISAMVGSVLFFFKVPNKYLIAIGFSSLLFVTQFVVIYLLSVIEYKNLVYRIDENSISLRRGFFSADTETIPFEKIKNSSFDQSLIQRLFAVGDITIDQDDEKFYWTSIDIATADKIQDAVSAKSNIQPIVVSPEQASALQPAANQPAAS